MTEQFRVAIAGLGTVGTGVVKVLQENAGLIAARAGRPVQIVAVSARNRAKLRDVDLTSYRWLEDPRSIPNLPDCDAVIELIGGEDGIAKEIVEQSLANGKSVITANKALLAKHGFELVRIAEENNAVLAYEAAVAGGIPIIKEIREGFASNRIDAVYGILNGTCNYILSEMETSGRSFRDVLAEAQENGYAEADPSLDIDGIDAAHKLALLMALAFGVKPEFERMRINGIRHITADDMRFAGELGYTIKLLAISRLADEINGKDNCITQTVEPCLVTKQSTLGSVGGVFNAIQVRGDFVGDSITIGRGAGAGPTATAVVADIIDLSRGRKLPCFGLPTDKLLEADWADSSFVRSRFYLRLHVLDKAGVLADIAAILRDRNISISSLLQYGRDPGQPVHVVLTTHEASQGDIAHACEDISALSSVIESPCAIRIEDL
jgi:homoserine dehydrogenase